MPSMRKSVLFFALAVVAGFVFTGCGGSGSPSAPTPTPIATVTPTPTPAPTPTPTPTPDPQAGLAEGPVERYDAKLKTTLGARAVTPGYSPPEQYGLGATDAQSDIYALGATLYCLLTGREPPASVDIVSGSAASPLPAHQVNSQVPMEIGAAIQKAMQVSRADRFASVSEFRMALTAPPLSPFRRRWTRTT